MTHTLTPSAQKVQSVLKGLGFSFQVRELPESTRTSSDAASAIGCKVEQIAKSIVFRGKDNHQPILVIASGVNRINEEKLSKLVGESVNKRSPPIRQLADSHTSEVFLSNNFLGRQEDLLYFL